MGTVATVRRRQGSKGSGGGRTGRRTGEGDESRARGRGHDSMAQESTAQSSASRTRARSGQVELCSHGSLHPFTSPDPSLDSGPGRESSWGLG